MVMDADAINALEGNKHVLRRAKAPVILTPHIGEMARLLNDTRYKMQDARTNPLYPLC